MKLEAALNGIPIISALTGKPVWPLPIWLMRQAGRYLPEYRVLRAKAGSFWTMCMTPELAAEVTFQPIKRFDFDAAIIFSDILTIPAALGQQVRIEDGVGPVLMPFPGTAKLVRDETALLPVYDALRIVRAGLAPAKALIGFAGAPWTLVSYMLGENGSPEERRNNVRAVSRKAEFHTLMNILTETVTDHLVAQANAGANIVQIFDSWAGGLRDEEFNDFVVAPTKMVVSGIRRRAPAAKVIGFPRAASHKQYMAYMRETDVDGLSIDTGTSIEWAARELGGAVTVQGNLDPEFLVVGGAALDAAAAKIVQASRGIPFIFNLGHGVLPQTPLAHVERLVKRVRKLSAP
jgi:uroporphyrinogen decarboxylase